MVTSMPKKLRPTDEKETSIKQVDANAFTYMLINAVQELSEQNERSSASCAKTTRTTPIASRVRARSLNADAPTTR
jgi:hypothetical protein